MTITDAAISHNAIDATPVSATDLTIREVIEAQTAGQLIVAADDYGWWTDLLNRRPVTPDSGIETIVADGLVRAGFLTRTGNQLTLTVTGGEVAENRGFVRVVVRGWEPTFRQLSDRRYDEHIEAATDPGSVARGCTDIARRRPEILGCIGSAIAAGTPGVTIDLGCADAGRIMALAAVAPAEHFIGIDIETQVIVDATAEVERVGLDARIDLRDGSVQPDETEPAWLADIDRERVTTAISFFLLHQLASDGGGILAVLTSWMSWFPNLERLVIGDGIKLTAPHWTGQPWFSPTYEIYHDITGVRLWTDNEYCDAFAAAGWHVVQRHSDHTMLVTTILERRVNG